MSTTTPIMLRTNPVVDNWIQLQKGLFDGWRDGFFPTIYEAKPTPVTSDVLEAGFIYAAVILGFSLLIILPGIRSTARLTTFIRIVFAVFVLVAIMLSNFGQEWEVAHITAKTQYRAGLSQEINAKIGVLIGLRSVNITLRGDPKIVITFEHGLVNETINYNERLSWDSPGWLIGRAGLGPYAGLFNREFREHQRKGSPYPILWIAEYFTLDGEGVRWGRHYQRAGFYAHICIWTAFAGWLLSMILYKMVISYGALASIFTGFCMFAGNVIFATVRNPYPLEIPFETSSKPDHLIFHYGGCFWLCLITGCLTTITGIVVLILDHVLEDKRLEEFFGIDHVNLDEFYPDADEVVDENDGRFRSRRFQRGTTMLRIAPTSPSAAGSVTFNPDDVDSRGGAEAEIVMDPHVQQPPHRYQRQLSPTGQAEAQRGYRRRTLFPASMKRPAPARSPRGQQHGANA